MSDVRVADLELREKVYEKCFFFAIRNKKVAIENI